MTIRTTDEIKELDNACTKLTEEDRVSHVGVINQLGHLVAGGFRKGIKPLLDDEKVRMTYMQMQLDFKMRQELDDVLGPIDYIASRRTKQLVISVPIGDSDLVLITAEPDADDKRIIKSAEDLFDDITISTI